MPRTKAAAHISDRAISSHRAIILSDSYFGHSSVQTRFATFSPRAYRYKSRASLCLSRRALVHPPTSAIWAGVRSFGAPVLDTALGKCGHQNRVGPPQLAASFISNQACRCRGSAYRVNSDPCLERSLSGRSGHWSALALNVSVANDPTQTCASCFGPFRNQHQQRDTTNHSESCAEEKYYCMS